MGRDLDQRSSRAAADVQARKSPLAIEDDYSRYEVTSRTEILTTLRGLQEAGSTLTCYLNHGYDFVLTSIVALSAEHNSLLLEWGSNPELNGEMLQADQISCATTKDKIKIQFSLDGVDAGKHAGRDAFLANIPKTLVRLQRREFYRLATPIVNPLICNVQVTQADGSRLTVAATVSDISVGGVGLVVPPGQPAFQLGAEFALARISMPNAGVLSFAMRVHKLYQVTLASGHVQQRAGCHFVKLPGAMENMIQRYIIQVERDRKVLQA